MIFLKLYFSVSMTGHKYDLVIQQNGALILLSVTAAKQFVCSRCMLLLNHARRFSWLHCLDEVVVELQMYGVLMQEGAPQLMLACVAGFRP